MLIKHDSEVAPVGASVNRTARLTSLKDPMWTNRAPPPQQEDPPPISDEPRASRSTNYRAQKCTE